jgi:phospholipid/cholesterol/gamma-HCH transport system ATP-binding protein
MPETIINIRGLTNILNGVKVHDRLNFNVHRGEIIGIIGGSGSGKTTLLRNILMLLRPNAGSIRLFDEEVIDCSEKTSHNLRHRFSVMFQQGALFSNLTVLENVLFPLHEFSHLPADFAQDLALLKLKLVGLPPTAAHLRPSELSGGMQKRAAAARALALDPELLFLDEPTSGLDPKSSADFDSLILELRDMLGLTIVIITHDSASLERLTDRVAFLGAGKVLVCGPVTEIKADPHPLIQAYFA